MEHYIENMFAIAHLVALDVSTAKKIYIYIDSCCNAMDNLMMTCETKKAAVEGASFLFSVNNHKLFMEKLLAAVSFIAASN